jgi:hypothetical protein
MVGVVFLVVAIIAGLWSAAIYQAVYNKVLDTLPPQFQTPLTSRYVFPEFALDASVPLPMQANYIRSRIGFCVMSLSLSLSLFSFHQPILGGVFLVSSVVGVFSTIKSRKTFRENLLRALTHDNRGAGTSPGCLSPQRNMLFHDR